jgi:hypothetical protein
VKIDQMICMERRRRRRTAAAAAGAVCMSE